MKKIKCELYILVSDEESINIGDSINFDNSYLVRLTVKPDTKLEEMLKGEKFLKLIFESLKLYSMDPEYFNKNIVSTKEFIESKINILKSANYIEMGYHKNLRQFLLNNPIFKTKRIHIMTKFEVNKETLTELKNVFNGFDNITISTRGNKNPINLKDYETTVLAVEKIVQKIKKYNLSPIEQIMYAYDLIRENIYKTESNIDKESISRDLTSVIKGNKIVCVGFANMFEVVLKNLGIRSQKFYIVKKEEPKLGHVRNIIYVQDPKYGIDGVYHFDTTWDSKKNDEDKSYLNSYNYFCKTTDEMNDYTKDSYINVTFSWMDDDTLDDFMEDLLEDGISSINSDNYIILDELSDFIEDKSIDLKDILYKKNEDIYEKIQNYINKFSCNEITGRQLLKIIYNVRKIEYYEKPEYYPFDLDKFEKFIYRSEPKTSEDFLLKALGLFNYSLSADQRHELFKNFDLERKISQVKLTKTLKNIKNNSK